MVKTNLVAWTPSEKNPPYLSINYISSIEGAVEISIRERGKESTAGMGTTASVVLTQDEFNTVLAELKHNIWLNSGGNIREGNKCDCDKCTNEIVGCGVSLGQQLLNLKEENNHLKLSAVCVYCGKIEIADKPENKLAVMINHMAYCEKQPVATLLGKISDYETLIQKIKDVLYTENIDDNKKVEFIEEIIS